MSGSQAGSDTLTSRMTGPQIADDLAERIRAGQYPAGTQLVYGDLMALYDVSRSTIQRAMGRLEALELVEYLPGRGRFVRAAPSQ